MEIAGPVGLGYVQYRRAVRLAPTGERIDRGPAMMTDVGDPAAILLDDDRLECAAALQIAVADEAHVERFCTTRRIERLVLHRAQIGARRKRKNRDRDRKPIAHASPVRIFMAGSIIALSTRRLKETQNDKTRIPRRGRGRGSERADTVRLCRRAGT